MDPIRLTHFEYGGQRFSFRKPITVNVEYTDGIWVYHNEPLNLWGVGERREAALNDLHDNFAYLWREIAEESDDRLDDKAKEIKRALLEARANDASAPGV